MDVSTIEKAADLAGKSSELPPASEAVAQLIAVEKTNRKKNPQHTFAELLGTWKLRLITGTKKTRAKAGIVLGAGRYVPKFIDIELSYQTAQPAATSASASPPAREGKQASNSGRVENSVKLGIISLTLTGPVKFLPPKNILVFDFTTITVKIGSLSIYHGYIRNGRSREREFGERAIAKSAFFVYFLIRENFIAARGRGGGLALWTRIE